MDGLRRFWRQPSSHYRNFQIVCTLLALHFLVPALAYLVAPDLAIDQFSRLNQWLGGAAYDAPEARSYVFRFSSVAYATGMGGMCVWMQRSLRDRFAVLGPIVTIEAFAGVLWLGGYFFSPGAPVMLVAAAFDFVIAIILAAVTLLARADAHRLSNGALVPSPVELTDLEWAHFEQRWVESILADIIPARPEDDFPGFAEVDLGDFWERYLESVPLQFRLGLRAATWVITLWPILTLRSYRLYHALSDDRRDDILQSIEHSKFVVVRQITFVFKATASFAYFRSPEVKQRFPRAYETMSAPGTDDSTSS